MKKTCLNKKTGIVFFSLLIILATTKQGFSQLIYQPYSYQFYQKFNSAEYSPDGRLHTSLKPYLLTDSTAVKHVYDSIMTYHIDTAGKTWLHRVLFSGHVADVKRKKYTFYLDYLPDLQYGKELADKQTVWLNTRGFEFGATYGNNVFVYTSAYENQGKFPNYVGTYISQTKVIPSEIQVNGIPFASGSIDWTYSTALIGYKPNKDITITLGQDKIFVGDGYRSVLLSDFAPVYPLLQFTINLSKNIQYTAVWAYMEDQNAPQFNSFISNITTTPPTQTFINNRRKWAAFHYIDWNITNRASIGFFNAIIDEEADNAGNFHGFDANYVDPIYFSSSFGPSNPVPDHTLFGFTAKYKILNKTTLYGQLLFDQSSSSGSVSASQAGLRGSDLFAIKNLNYIFEYNSAGPNTYYGQNPIVNYTQLSEPLADPYGANFKELLGIINYSIWKLDFQFEGNYAKLGANAGSTNYGSGVIEPQYINVPQVIGTNTNGLPGTVKYAEGTLSYMLNPKYNFRIEVGGLLREFSTSQSNAKTAMITIGLRSSFRNLYHDF